MVTVARSLNWLIPSSRDNERLVSEAIKSTILSKGLDEFGHPQLWFYDFLRIAPLHTAIRWGLFITTRKHDERDDPTYRAADWTQFFDMLRTHNSLPAKYLNVYLGELVETGSRDIGIAEQLVTWGASIEDSGVLAKAVDAGDLNFLSFVLSRANKFRDPSQVDTAFSQAASRGNLDVVRIFVQKGVPISNYVAEAAYCSGQYDVALFLLQHGAEVPNLRRILPLLPEHLRDQFQHLFLNFGALPNPSGESLLVLVAQEGDFETVKALIEEGVDINSVIPITQKSGRQEYFTPLSAAAEQGHLEILSFLLAKGAHVNPAPAMATPGPYGGISRSIEAVAPLLKAALNGHVEAVEMLIANGANVHKVLETLSEMEGDGNDDDQKLTARLSKVQEVLVRASEQESKERELSVEESIKDNYE
ncbi:ankyrin repeat-containing domain protein [Flagelloscypha sp. PMI_526]|nr:ankyrin repeat-containing domain protein [Flagelloscypha sp. PMI_526]